jgi:hypothetical protein
MSNGDAGRRNIWHVAFGESFPDAHMQRGTTSHFSNEQLKYFKSPTEINIEGHSTNQDHYQSTVSNETITFGTVLITLRQ